ncbi:hypothetical protein FA15DRAFT_334702 [Coprinopsis marcescibilis]|uniref:Uncharacterized protein n=1 Tax=Coprinopsis marcescibilis TaxID=230819 RepID=A0A5C3KZ65_COPMA|nr:hypothetical protein FA15DRAFT_334702 [Coprinopsis marcescibilis]
MLCQRRPWITASKQFFGEIFLVGRLVTFLAVKGMSRISSLPGSPSMSGIFTSTWSVQRLKQRFIWANNLTYSWFMAPLVFSQHLLCWMSNLQQ